MDSAVEARGAGVMSEYLPRNEKALTRALWLTLAYLIVEIVGGFLTHSLALLADAGHMLTDVGGLALALIAIRYARRSPTERHSYGFYRAEILAAVANAVVLLGISGFVLYHAYERFSNPPVIESVPMLAIAVVGLIVNLFSMRILHGGATESLNVKGAYFEVLSDFITSIGVIIGAAIIWATGWTRVDALISAGIGLFIVPRTWLLLREGIGVLLEGTPADIDVAAVRQALLSIDDVVDVHDLHVWALTSEMNVLTVHVVAAAASNGVLLSAIAERMRTAFGIDHVTAQVEQPGWECQGGHA